MPITKTSWGNIEKYSSRFKRLLSRITHHLFYWYAILIKLFSQSQYDKYIVKSHQCAGVRFAGKPEYIDYNSHLDPSGGLTISKGVVISTKVIILTHDWSFLKGFKSLEKAHVSPIDVNKIAYKEVCIGEESFIGAGVVILPGTKIGKLCIIGAGAVVKGNIPDYSVVAGNPAKVINDTRRYGEKILCSIERVP